MLEDSRIWSTLNFETIATIDKFLRPNEKKVNSRRHLKAAIEWLKRAQDAAGNGGVSAGYFRYIGWESAYPETTGYIIPTMFDYYRFANDKDSKNRAIKMSDYLIDIQFDNGSFARWNGLHFNRHQDTLRYTQIDPDVFDTGQCMQGLVRCYKETKCNKYLASAVKAGNWLVTQQDEDGAWRKYSWQSTAYPLYTRVALTLMQLYEFVNDEKYKKTAIKNIDWAVTKCTENGWYQDCVPLDSALMPNPLTHFIAYTVEGILECGILLNNDYFIQTATRTLNSLLRKFTTDGWMRATYDKNWESQDNFSCLAGDAQIAGLWLRLFELTNKQPYYGGAIKLNNYVKNTQYIHYPCKGIEGGVKGSQPIYGKYQSDCYVNWAAKFLADSLLRQEVIDSQR